MNTDPILQKGICQSNIAPFYFLDPLRLDDHFSHDMVVSDNKCATLIQPKLLVFNEHKYEIYDVTVL